MINTYNVSRPRQPNSPNSSANTAKMKSVELSGRNSNCDWVLPSQPEAAPPDQLTRYDYNPDQARKLLEPVVRDLGARELTTDAAVAKVSIVGAGIQNAPGYAARMFGVLADAGINIEMISTSEIKMSVVIAAKFLELAVRELHAAFGLDAAPA